MRILAVFIISFLISSPISGQKSLRIIESDICIEGSSNIHEWISYVHWLDLQYVIKLEDNQKFTIEDLCIDIPVNAIFSRRGQVMDDKTWEALKEEQFPNIIYTFQEVSSMEKIKNGYLLNTKGFLEIAGVENKIFLPVYAYELEDGTFQMYGEKKISMTDFNVAPPEGVLGYVKVEDDIVLKFELSLITENLIPGEVIREGIPKKQIN